MRSACASRVTAPRRKAARPEASHDGARPRGPAPRRLRRTAKDPATAKLHIQGLPLIHPCSALVRRQPLIIDTPPAEAALEALIDNRSRHRDAKRAPGCQHLKELWAPALPAGASHIPESHLRQARWSPGHLALRPGIQRARLRRRATAPVRVEAVLSYPMARKRRGPILEPSRSARSSSPRTSASSESRGHSARCFRLVARRLPRHLPLVWPPGR